MIDDDHLTEHRTWAELRDHLIGVHNLDRNLIDRPRPLQLRRDYAEMLHAGAHVLEAGGQP